MTNITKKLNLLPEAVKIQYLNRSLSFGIAAIIGIGLVLVLSMYGKLAVLSYQIGSLQKENAAYNTEKAKMETLQDAINQHKKFLDTYESAKFPFIRFISDLEEYRPFGVCILSVDSPDRLMNEGAEKENTESEQKEPKTSQTKQNTVDDAKEEEKNEKDTSESAMPEISYKKDLSGEKLVIRGYSSDQEAVSKFFYDLSRLPYITDSQISGIEQHMMDGSSVNFFEFTVMGGTL